MQLKEDFRTYETLRREHDAQIVQIATEAGLRIAPDQWSSLLYGITQLLLLKQFGILLSSLYFDLDSTSMTQIFNF